MDHVNVEILNIKPPCQEQGEKRNCTVKDSNTSIPKRSVVIIGQQQYYSIPLENHSSDPDKSRPRYPSLPEIRWPI